MIGNYNPRITKGGGWLRVLTCTQDGSVFSLVGYTATMTMTPSGGTTVTPALTINGAAGTITAKLTATEVAAINWDQGVVISLLTASPSDVYGEAIALSGIASLI